MYFCLYWVFVAALRLPSSCGAGALGPWASVLAARGLSSCDDWP